MAVPSIITDQSGLIDCSLRDLDGVESYNVIDISVGWLRKQNTIPLRNARVFLWACFPLDLAFTITTYAYECAYTAATKAIRSCVLKKQAQLCPRGLSLARCFAMATHKNRNTNIALNAGQALRGSEDQRSGST